MQQTVFPMDIENEIAPYVFESGIEDSILEG